MGLHIGSIAPDFEQDSTAGKIKFHDYIGNGWAVLLSEWFAVLGLAHAASPSERAIAVANADGLRLVITITFLTGR